MGPLKDLLVALGLFLLVFVAGGALAWLIMAFTSMSMWVSGLATQLTFLTASLAIMKLLNRSWSEFGFKIKRLGLLKASIISLAASSVLALPALLWPELGRTQAPADLTENLFVLVALSLLVGPICEEVFFRGLLQGYLLLKGHERLSIAVPALLFSAVHAIPFSSSGFMALLLILLGALVLSLIAGYFRAMEGSLLHPIAIHFWFNFTGFIIYLASALHI